jgi:hypothetical protein
MSKKITTSVQSEGFEAVLYPGDGRKDKVMIVMSGSNGGMTLTKQEAEFYHKNGIPALALALFKTKHPPALPAGVTGAGNCLMHLIATVRFISCRCSCGRKNCLIG